MGVETLLCAWENSNTVGEKQSTHMEYGDSGMIKQILIKNIFKNICVEDIKKSWKHQSRRISNHMQSSVFEV